MCFFDALILMWLTKFVPYRTIRWCCFLKKNYRGEGIVTQVQSFKSQRIGSKIWQFILLYSITSIGKYNIFDIVQCTYMCLIYHSKTLVLVKSKVLRYRPNSNPVSIFKTTLNLEFVFCNSSLCIIWVKFRISIENTNFCIFFFKDLQWSSFFYLC